MPDDLLARAADTLITHTRNAVTAVRQLGMLSSHAQIEIDAARTHTDMLLALPALLLRPAKRSEPTAHRIRRDDQYSSVSPAAPSSDEAAHPQGTDNISFSAVLRRRLQKAEKGELAELLHEAIREREKEGNRQAAMRLRGPATARGNQEDDPAAGDEKRFEKAIAHAEAHNTRRALAVVEATEQIPRDERTRQAMREKACVEVPLDEQLQVIAFSNWLLTNVQHQPVTQRETKAALARLALRGTRAPGPSGSRTNLLVSMGTRAGGVQAVRDLTNIILEGLPPGLAQKWLSTILEPCDQGPRPEPTEGWPLSAGPTERRKVRPVTLAETWVNWLMM